ncbi:MAG: hypothetical protein ACYTG1_05180 [Planctomycetota bacterium]|jgi:hypothetical protein
MADVIAPRQTVRFTITKTPRREAERRTIQRLMQMQPDVKKGLRRLARRRKLHDNRTYIRAGCEWVDRKKATKLALVAAGESFTIQLTPQIIPDVRSVEKYLQAEPAA